MKIFEICFSPTGGTKKVADILAGGLQGDIEAVDLTDCKTKFQDIILDQDDVAIVAVPSYGGRVPSAAIEQFLKIKGNGSRAILVCVYGNRAYKDTLVELQYSANEAGFRVIAAVSAVAEHSMARQVAKGRPNNEDQAQLLEYAKQIQKKVLEENTAKPKIPGGHPDKKSGKIGIVPKPTKDCTQCGVCARKCPVQAIDAKDPKKVDSKACISCMRCVSICPHAARKINGFIRVGVSMMLKIVCSGQKENELFL